MTLSEEELYVWFKSCWQYEFGTPEDKLQRIAPETYTLDYALMASKEKQEIQLDIFKDYQSNVELYSRSQEWFREKKVPILVVVGRNDVLFVKDGAEAFKQDGGENVEVHLLDAGHFAVESHTEEIAGLILRFLRRWGV